MLCGARTDASICCTTECERACVQSGRPSWWVYLYGYLTLGWFGATVVGASAGEDKESGKDRIFPLPLRVCGACQKRLTSPTEVKAALNLVPLYRQLLNKYPDAKVSSPLAP